MEAIRIAQEVRKCRIRPGCFKNTVKPVAKVAKQFNPKILLREVDGERQTHALWSRLLILNPASSVGDSAEGCRSGIEQPVPLIFNKFSDISCRALRAITSRRTYSLIARLGLTGKPVGYLREQYV